MIVKESKSLSVSLVLKIIIGLAVVGGLVYLFQQPSVQRILEDGVYLCDAEQVEGKKFVGTKGILFDGAAQQSSEYARSGKYSCKLKKKHENQYGFGIKLPNFTPGEIYRVSVWRLRNEGGDDGFLIASGSRKGKDKFYHSAPIVQEKDGNWEKLALSFKVPVFDPIDQISIYVYSKGNYVLYFDDLKIERIALADSVAQNIVFQPPHIQMEVAPKSIDKLKKKRSDAYRVGILESADDDWVKAKIETPTNEPNLKANIRLKGDWLDHLKKDKWSFRIKMKGDDRWERLHYFSIHTPEARSFLHEWVLHQFYKKEKVLTTYYDFALVNLNEKQLGVYAVEEHFDKILVERQQRREGPIIRFSEDGFWTGIKRQIQQLEWLDHGIHQNVKAPESSDIRPFQEGKTLKSDALRPQLEIAQNLLYQYKYGLKPADEIFDLDYMARYYAICDAMGAYHGLAWHNQRFYYNPVTTLLEPIGFDGFTEKVERNNEILGQGKFNRNNIKEEKLENLLFLNVEFNRLYTKYLMLYTSREYLENFFAEISDELKAREIFLQEEWPNYSINVGDIIHNAQRKNVLIMPFNNLTLKTFTSAANDRVQQLQITSIHALPIEVIGSGPTADQMKDTFPEPLLLESYYTRLRYASALETNPFAGLPPEQFQGSFINQKAPIYQPLSVRSSSKYLFYRPIGVDSIFHSAISPKKAPINSAPAQNIFSNATLVSNSIYTVTDKMVYFRKGTHQSKNSIIIPKGYRVIFEPGTELDLIQKAKFISRSPVIMRGTSEEPIKIFSSDRSANGFTVLQANGSELEYTIFEHLNTLQDQGWTLTGAVTFYESDVHIAHTVFRDNHCEDALNTVRSNFVLEESLISRTFGDGFDADFCKGTIKKTRFFNTGNDAMDFSGSLINIVDCEIDGAGDKGVSVGEDSEAGMLNTTIKNSNIGLAAKDLSSFSVKDVRLENCNLGIAAYQKKPEYGGSTILIQKYKATGVTRLYNINKNCSLKLNDKVIIGE